MRSSAARRPSLRSYSSPPAIGGFMRLRTRVAARHRNALLVRSTLRRPAVWLGTLVFFFYAGVETVTAQWSYSLLTLGRGVPETAAGLFVTLYWGSHGRPDRVRRGRRPRPPDQPNAFPRRSGARRQRDRLPDRGGVAGPRGAHRSDGCTRRRIRARGHRAAILVLTLILLALHEGFTRQGSFESPRAVSAAP